MRISKTLRTSSPCLSLGIWAIVAPRSNEVDSVDLSPHRLVAVPHYNPSLHRLDRTSQGSLDRYAQPNVGHRLTECIDLSQSMTKTQRRTSILLKRLLSVFGKMMRCIAKLFHKGAHPS